MKKHGRFKKENQHLLVHLLMFAIMKVSYLTIHKFNTYRVSKKPGNDSKCLYLGYLISFLLSLFTVSYSPKQEKKNVRSISSEGIKVAVTAFFYSPCI